MADEKLIFPIGFDLEAGVKEVEKEWKSTYQKQLQNTINTNPIKIKVDLDAKGLDLSKLKEYNQISKEMVATAKANAQVRKQEAMASERERIAEEKVATAKAKRLSAEERLAQAKLRTKKITEQQNQAYARQSSYLSRLVTRMIAYASISQVSQFLRNIRSITAEFELQRVALGAIIGDMHEANTMFEQIKAAAVKSPFQIKELVTYTKQLAAYKIETEDLFETTQRLADISAGLGVSMDRLVLAYGQIRATGYLRGSEVRQLTEAGIPIIESLAKKMSDLRGETVSAAEVMGLISERAISFGMVKEVFDDMTDAGGMFYKMQEKQSQTLAGQWSNLKDSIAIMYDEMGNTESVNNAMRGIISLVKSLAENWRIVGNVASWSVAAALGYAKVIKPISELIKKQQLLNKAKEAERVAEFNLARVRDLNANKANFIASKLVDDDYIKWLDETIDDHQRFADKHTQIAKEARKSAGSLKGFGGALKSIGSFIKANWVGILITAVATLVSWLVSARKEANRLNEELSKIGAEGALQASQSVRNFERLAKVIRESVDGSKEQTEALAEMKRAYADLLPTQDSAIINFAREKDGYDAITQAIREKVAMQMQEQKLNAIASEFGGRFDKDERKFRRTFSQYYSNDEISLLISEIRNAVDDELIYMEQSSNEQMEVVHKIMRDILGESVSWQKAYSMSVSPAFYNIINTQMEYNKAVQEVEDSMESATGSLGKYTQAYKDFKEELKDVTGTGEKFSFEWNESKTRNQIKAYNDFIASLLTKEGIKFDIGDTIDFKSLYETIGDNYPQLKQVVAKIQGEYEKLIPTDISRLIKDKLQEYSDQVGISMEEVKEHLKDNDKTTSDWAKGLKDSYDSLERKLAEYNKTQSAFETQGGPYRDVSEDIDTITKEMQVLELLMDFFKEFSDTTNRTKKTNPRIALLNEELSTVEKIYKEYQELRKYMDEEDAHSRIATMFEGVNFSILEQALSPEEMRAQIVKALDEAKKMGDKKQILELEYKLGKFDADEAQRTLEKQLKDLSDEISRTKAAQEFFDKMLGLTGDKQLSATLTLSVYGEDIGEDFSRAISDKMAEKATTIFEGVDISEAIDKATGRIDPVVLQGLIVGLPEERAKEAQDFVDDLVKKEGDYIQSLYKSYEQFLSFEEQKTQIIAREEAERDKIRKSNLSPEEQAKLIKASEERERREVGEVVIKEFKASDDWINTFEQIENLATPTIERIMAKLKEFIELNKEAFTPEQIKTLMSEYDKMYNEMIKRNPFKAITDGFEDWLDARERVKDAETKLGEAESKKSNLEYAVKLAQQRYDAAAISANIYGVSVKEVSDLQQDLVDTQTALNEATEAQATATQEYTDALNAEQKAIQKTITGFESAASAISSISNVVNDLIDLFGLAEDSELNYYLQDLVKWLGIMSGVLTTIAAIIAIIEAELAPILLVAGGIAAVASVIDYFANKSVRDAQEEIERLDKDLENLSYQFERLEKAQEDAFGTEYIQNYRKQLAILNAEAEAYRKQAELEQSKGKKEDEEKTKEYLESARDVEDEIADMQSSLSEKFLGGDLASTARDFAQAWIEAYKEFSNATDAMKAKFQDMVENMVVESVLASSMQKALEPVFTLIDNMGEGDFYNKDFWANVVSEMQKATDAGVAGANIVTQMLESMGVNIRGLGGDMTGISRDIATASEESILGLAAGINTQNFYISQLPSKLDTIISLMQGGTLQGAVDMQDLITIQNQHLSHLPNIAQNTADTVAQCKSIVEETKRVADNLDKVIKPRGTQATHSVNTSL